MSISETGASIAVTGTGRVAALGGGLIGRSWTALFLAAGRSVAVFDPDPNPSSQSAKRSSQRGP